MRKPDSKAPHSGSDVGSDPLEPVVPLPTPIAVIAPAPDDAAQTAATAAESATQIAAEATAEVAAETEGVAQIAVAAAVAAATAADQAVHARDAVADAFTAEAAARLALAQTAEKVSVELAQRVEAEARLLVHETELIAFAGMVAHDLKAPLRAIGGFTRILRTQLEDTNPDGADVACTASMDKIAAAVTRMGRLIEALLAYTAARDRPLRREPLNLQALVTHVIDDYASEQYAIGSSDPLPTINVNNLPYVDADPIMCRQLLDNLIGNALKYRRPDRPAHIQIHAGPESESESEVRVEIVDHGIGIPAGQHPMLFTPFHRAHTDYPGTGLGLAICQRIIERHGGTIGASDNPDGGSIFHFTLASIDEAGGP